ncbi:DnaB-like helicase C-terminal domain-containing protein [Oceanobacillus sp. J11TS1]|uniref:replicative DNA helicase n=1 Tax=Oceanobacillus sp. J11TS1 TaxID=2807191 RepID=UPI001B1FD34E|nr:DnaB-like helicase C-terminal domain-containing protein [Oceanobacillus sp. J11TS1]GIO22451.1 replicative DNA helicase [Oceanobacillus sp. J11TS1]
MSSIGVIEDLSAEQSVLGAVFLDPNVLDEIVFLEDRDFIDVTHQQIYRVMRWLQNKDKPVDIVTVTELYVQNNKADQLSVAYLTKLADSCPTTANVLYYANIVRSKAIRRRGVEMGEQIKALSRDDFDTDDDYFSAVESLVSELRPDERGKMKNLLDVRKEYFSYLMDKRVNYIETGFSQFDTWAKGLYRGDLVVLAGRPSVGKTAFSLQRLEYMAKRGPVLMYSQEMDLEQLLDRIVSRKTSIPFNRVKNKDLTPQELGRIEEVYNELEKLPLHIQDSSGVTIEEVRATARRFKRQYGDLAVVAVDYLQIMKINRKKNQSRAEAIGEVTQAAKQIARDLNCCFLLLSQMNRDSDKAPKKPTFSDLKESGSIEQDADVIEFLWVDANDNNEQQGKVVQHFVAKGRNTGLNEFRLLFRGWKQQFLELDKRK